MSTDSDAKRPPSVRAAVAADAAAIHALLTSMGYGADELDGLAERLDIASRPSSSLRVIVVDDGDVVGCAALLFTQSIEQPAPSCRVSVIVTRPDRRRQGVGRLLLDEAERRACEAGCFRIELTTAHDNGGAHAFYREVGWVETGLRFKRVFD